MYRARHFDADAFDLDAGYLQTTLSDDARMPLPFFVEYDDAWWFEIVTAVEVPTAAYDEASESSFIVLDIHYEDALLRAAQHVHFAGDQIEQIRTYASSTFFSTPTPLVELDRPATRCGSRPDTTSIRRPSPRACSCAVPAAERSRPPNRRRRRSPGSKAT